MIGSIEHGLGCMYLEKVSWKAFQETLSGVSNNATYPKHFAQYQQRGSFL